MPPPAIILHYVDQISLSMRCRQNFRVFGHQQHLLNHWSSSNSGTALLPVSQRENTAHLLATASLPYFMLTLLLLCGVTVCFSLSAFLLSSYSLTLNGCYIKTKQKHDALRQREPKKNEEKKRSKIYWHIDRLTEQWRDRKTVKIRY